MHTCAFQTMPILTGSKEYQRAVSSSHMEGIQRNTSTNSYAKGSHLLRRVSTVLLRSTARASNTVGEAGRVGALSEGGGTMCS